jgi:hypothetical protein
MTEIDWIAFLALISVFLIGACIACVRPSATGQPSLGVRPDGALIADRRETGPPATLPPTGRSDTS